MIPGPTLVFKCPKCGKFILRGSLISGNTFGGKLFSDGKMEAPMLPEFPNIIKCQDCKTFFWLNKENKIGKNKPFEKTKAEWKNACRAEFLSINEYDEAINLEVYNNEKDQKYLRIRLWRTFNDRIRKGENIFITKKDKYIYELNCIKLIAMLDKNDQNEKIMMAELFRNLGNYIECINILETIKEEKYIWIKEILKKECTKNNQKVIELKQ
jgi:hypothetical protein